MNRRKIKDKKLYDCIQLLQKWLDTDSVKGGYYFVDIEKRNEAFARGWRWGMKSAINELEKAYHEEH